METTENNEHGHFSCRDSSHPRAPLPPAAGVARGCGGGGLVSHTTEPVGRDPEANMGIVSAGDLINQRLRRARGGRPPDSQSQTGW